MRTYTLIGYFIIQLFFLTVFIAPTHAGEGIDGFKHITRSVTVYKSPTCGCCDAWVQHLQVAGFNTRVKEPANLSRLKQDLGVQPKYQACHTAAFKGYVFEGHVPATIIKHFLMQSPTDVLGLSVPGMPMGSPGMDNGRPFQDYEVLLLNKDGSSQAYAIVSNEGITYL